MANYGQLIAELIEEKTKQAKTSHNRSQFGAEGSSAPLLVGEVITGNAPGGSTVMAVQRAGEFILLGSPGLYRDE